MQQNEGEKAPQGPPHKGFFEYLRQGRWNFVAKWREGMALQQKTFAPTDKRTPPAS